MKNEFSYYSTTPLITWPVVINPDHLLLCGPHAHTHCESISHHTFALPLPLTPTALNIVLSVFLLPLSALHLSLSSLQFFSKSYSTHSFSSSLATFLLQQNPTSSPPMILATSPTSSSGKTQWSMTVAGRCFPVRGVYARTTSAAASSLRTRGPPS